MSLQTKPPVGCVDKDEAVSVLRQASARLIAAIRGIRNPDAPAVGKWSARDVAAHLGDAFTVHHQVARGENAPIDRMDEIADVNQRLIDANPERDTGKLADRVETALAGYLEFLDALDGDAIVQWAELTIPISAVVSADVGECLVHGYDISRAEGNAWHIDPYHAALVAKGVSPMTIHYVDPVAAKGLNAVFDVRLRGQCRLELAFEDGALSIGDPSGRKADVHISAAPGPFLLVGYGRLGQWTAVAKGQLLVWGRKPWLAAKFGSLLKNP